MVISAFSSRETGQLSFALAAADSNAAVEISGILALTFRCTREIVQPASSFSRVTAAAVRMLSGLKFIVLNWAESAMLKHAACAAAISSSGFVPAPCSKRVTKEYGALAKAPLSVDITPSPVRNVPFQTAVADRSIRSSFFFGEPNKELPAIPQGIRTILPRAPGSITATWARVASASGISWAITGRSVLFSRPATRIE